MKRKDDNILLLQQTALKLRHAIAFQ